MLIRTKWRLCMSWRHFGWTLWRSQLLCSWRNFYFFNFISKGPICCAESRGDQWSAHACLANISWFNKTRGRRRGFPWSTWYQVVGRKTGKGLSPSLLLEEHMYKCNRFKIYLFCKTEIPRIFAFCNFS